MASQTRPTWLPSGARCRLQLAGSFPRAFGPARRLIQPPDFAHYLPGRWPPSTSPSYYVFITLRAHGIPTNRAPARSKNAAPALCVPPESVIRAYTVSIRRGQSLCAISSLEKARNFRKSGANNTLPPFVQYAPKCGTKILFHIGFPTERFPTERCTFPII